LGAPTGDPTSGPFELGAFEPSFAFGAGGKAGRGGTASAACVAFFGVGPGGCAAGTGGGPTVESESAAAAGEADATVSEAVSATANDRVGRSRRSPLGGRKGPEVVGPRLGFRAV
jgi:hypothetical protein